MLLVHLLSLLLSNELVESQYVLYNPSSYNSQYPGQGYNSPWYMPNGPQQSSRSINYNGGYPYPNIQTSYYQGTTMPNYYNPMTTQQSTWSSQQPMSTTTMSPFLNNYNQPAFGDYLQDNKIGQDEECNAGFQQQIAQCGQQLLSYGIINQSPVYVEQYVPIAMKIQSQGQLRQLCKAHQTFLQCIGGKSARNICFKVGRISGPFAIADAALDYTCNEGFDTTLTHLECLHSMNSSPSVLKCEAMSRLQDSALQITNNFIATTTPLCNTMQQYFDCIRGSIESQCGRQADDAARESIQRAVQVRAPLCQISAAIPIIPSILLLTFIISSFLL